MKRDRATTFFTPAETEAIRQAVAAAEVGTIGEIVPLVVDRSDDYREALLAAALLLAALLALLVLILVHHDSIWWYLPLVTLFFVPLRYLVGRMPYLALAFISRRRFAQAVRDRAVRSFYEQGLYRTRAATGVLIFISLFERRVWILGDRGINARIAPEQWQGMVDQLVAGIRQGSAPAALCAVIQACGQLLQQHFPDQGNDQNELPDDLLAL